jgi:plasmid stabilization system protein ParE
MGFRVEIAPRALADIDEAFLYIKQDSRERASKWLLGIIDAISSLEAMPARCVAAPESVDAGKEVRVLLFGKRQHVYRIFFSIQVEDEDKGVVRVLHVRHGAQRRLEAGELQQLMQEGEA